MKRASAPDAAEQEDCDLYETASFRVERQHPVVEKGQVYMVVGGDEETEKRQFQPHEAWRHVSVMGRVARNGRLPGLPRLIGASTCATPPAIQPLSYLAYAP